MENCAAEIGSGKLVCRKQKSGHPCQLLLPEKHVQDEKKLNFKIGIANKNMNLNRRS